MAGQDPPRPQHRWFAAFYDFTDQLGRKRMAPLRRRLVGDLAGDVLEVGCGAGASFEYYDWPRINVLEATEPDPHMLRRAEPRRKALPGQEQRKLRLSEAPAEALPFPDERFDAVVSSLVLCSVADLERAVQEMQRVLKPGGELRLLEHVAREGRWGKVQRAVQPVYGWMSAGCRLDRRTEVAIRDAGLALDVWERQAFSPLHPAFLGVATKKGGGSNPEGHQPGGPATTD